MNQCMGGRVLCSYHYVEINEINKHTMTESKLVVGKDWEERVIRSAWEGGSGKTLKIYTADGCRAL